RGFGGVPQIIILFSPPKRGAGLSLPGVRGVSRGAGVSLPGVWVLTCCVAKIGVMRRIWYEQEHPSKAKPTKRKPVCESSTHSLPIERANHAHLLLPQKPSPLHPSPA